MMVSDRPENGGKKLLRNIGNMLLIITAPFSRTLCYFEFIYFFLKRANLDIRPPPRPYLMDIRSHFRVVKAVRDGPGSSVGIATDYGLEGPGSNAGGDEILRPSRPALGPTQPPVQWVLGLSRGRGVRGVGLTPTPI